MVFIDISTSSSAPNTKPTGLASGLDRTIAFLFDLVLFAPTFGILLSPIVKKIEYRFYTSPDSVELLALMGVMVLAVASLTILAQTICLYCWSATPGKMIFKMKVHSVTGSQLTITQSFLRSSLWVAEWFFFGLPFLEIFGHRDRRPMHDRASETKVVTFKTERKRTPHPIETHVIRQVIMSGMICLLVMVLVVSGRVYRSAVQGKFKRESMSEEQYLCQIPGVGMSDPLSRRLDRGIALFLMNEIEESCLLSEADFAFWTNQPESLAWANLAKGFYYRFDKDKSARYFKETCAGLNSASDPCLIANQSISHKEPPSDVKPKRVPDLRQNSLAFHALKLEDYWKNLDNDNIKLEVKYLENEFPDSSHLQAIKIKSLWLNQAQERAYGAYESARPWLKLSHRSGLQAWMCLREVENGCQQVERRACSDLRAQWKTSMKSPGSGPELIALLRDRDCRRLPEPTLMSLQPFFLNNPDYKNFVLSVFRDSSWTEDHRLNSLRELASSSQVENDLRVFSAQELLRRTKDVRDLDLVHHWIDSEMSAGWEKHVLTQELKSRFVSMGVLRAPASKAAVAAPKIRIPQEASVEVIEK